jgi:Rrf2 family nitric oxide-sensitive transcriptional repressor
MRITKRTNIAIRLLMFCAVNPDRLVTKAEIAERCNTSESHLAQIVNRLGQLGFLRTQRGRTGGVTLGRPMADISVACRLRHALTDAVEAFYLRLDTVTLDALVCGNDALFSIFCPPACVERA